MEGQKLEKKILVQKFGGSSVAGAKLLKNAARRVAANHREGWSVVVVVSAMGNTTDELVALSREVSGRPVPREMDMLLHAGEIISASLLAMALAEEGVPSISLTGSQAGMLTDSSHTRARVQEVQGKRILEELNAGRVVVVTGFQGMSAQREITTLGRGGSDTSAMAIAAGVGASRCEILTDVDGIYTADPRVVSRPRKMAWCSYDELLELSVLGARVMHSRSVEIARRFEIPFQVCSSMSGEPGTWISSSEMAQKELNIMEQVTIRGITSNQEVAKISILSVPDRPGVAAEVFEKIGSLGINLLLIVQAESHAGTNDLTFVVDQGALSELKPLLDETVASVQGKRVVVDENVATVSVVGEGVYREAGLAARAFRALAGEGINIDLISTSNLMITCVVPQDRMEDGVRVLHRTFFPNS